MLLPWSPKGKPVGDMYCFAVLEHIVLQDIDVESILFVLIENKSKSACMLILNCDCSMVKLNSQHSDLPCSALSK